MCLWLLHCNLCVCVCVCVWRKRYVKRTPAHSNNGLRLRSMCTMLLLLALVVNSNQFQMLWSYTLLLWPSILMCTCTNHFDTNCSHLNFNLCPSLLLLLLPCKHLLHDVVFPCQEESHLLSLLGAVLRWSHLQQVQLSHFSTDSLGITFL